MKYPNISPLCCAVRFDIWSLLVFVFFLFYYLYFDIKCICIFIGFCLWHEGSQHLTTMPCKIWYMSHIRLLFFIPIQVDHMQFVWVIYFILISIYPIIYPRLEILQIFWFKILVSVLDKCQVWDSDMKWYPSISPLRCHLFCKNAAIQIWRSWITNVLLFAPRL